MIDALFSETFILKSEDEAWQLFETLSENSLHHMSATSREQPMSQQKRDGIYQIENVMDIHSKIDELSQKLDRLLNTGHSSILPNPVQDVCALCASPTHFVSECPTAPQFSEFVHEQVQQAQAQQALDQKMIHIRTLIIPVGETTQIFSEDHSQWLALLYLDQIIRIRYIGMDHTISFKILFNHLSLVTAQLLRIRF